MSSFFRHDMQTTRVKFKTAMMIACNGVASLVYNALTQVHYLLPWNLKYLSTRYGNNARLLFRQSYLIWYCSFHGDNLHIKIMLIHCGRVTHICVGKLIIIGSDNGLSPDRHQAIIWINAGLLSIGPLRTYFSENLIKMQQFSLKKMHVKMSSAKWRLSCLGLNVLIPVPRFPRFYRVNISDCWPLQNVNTFNQWIISPLQNNIDEHWHHSDVIMGAMASQITSLTIVNSTAYPGADQRNYQSSASLVLWEEFTGDLWSSRTNGQ